MAILVVNCGSSSIKVSLFDKETRLFDFHLKGLHTKKPVLEIDSQEKALNKSLSISEGLSLIFSLLEEKKALSSLTAIGHRFVHGGSQYRSTMRPDPKLVTELGKLSSLAPLHNDACLAGIKACLKLRGKVPEFVVFDTSFHQTMPPVATYYAISQEHHIQRYGFHGISHAYLWQAYVAHGGKATKVITLHLGNGCSTTAISGGVSIDTSMGFTPSEGLVMGTRAGDIDSAALEYLSLEELNFHSGLLGVSQVSSEVEDLLPLYQKNERVKLAIDLFCYRVIKYLGAYTAVLGGVEAVIFSGGIGEHSPFIREQIVSKMTPFGWKIDQKANEQAASGKIQKISHSSSSVSVFVIPSDENLFIAREVQRTLQE